MFNKVNALAEEHRTGWGIEKKRKTATEELNKEGRQMAMMTRTEAMGILAKIEVSESIKLKACRKMNKMIDDSKFSGLYKKQGGTMFKFCDGSVAWITVWMFEGNRYYHLTERGEGIYTGMDGMKCAEMLYKLGVAHKTIGASFLGCA